MANGHVEIHDPFTNHLSSSTDCDHKSTSDSDSMEDSVEFRVLMAYAERRRPKKDVEVLPTQDSLSAQNGGTNVKGPSSPQTPAKTEKEEKKKKKKKKRGWKRLPGIFSCFKPQAGCDELPRLTITSKPDVEDRCGDFIENGREEIKKDKFNEIATILTEIADEIPFIPPELEADSSEDDVEKMIALLLREAGDQLNEKELINAKIAKEIFWNYGFFKKLMTTLLMRMGLVSSEPDALGPHASPKTQIAVACEITSRLSAVNTLPMNRMLDHGARYLQDHYSSWAQQQGGYEEAFYSDDEDDIQ
ncbi:apoptosis facilitator Bcl-2-like protein 14 [Enoplosus armatus]|uniref:apoptosis facilitator Bcl-2-like protein 14 n=1 Tax=Enoplosus armatus TaxID=215367 RepID=UPI0039938107